MYTAILYKSNVYYNLYKDWKGIDKNNNNIIIYYIVFDFYRLKWPDKSIRMQ